MHVCEAVVRSKEMLINEAVEVISLRISPCPAG